MRCYNIPVFVPHKGCPHDCVFCNQRRITGFSDEVSADYVRDITQQYLKSFKETERRVEIAFFGGSFTAVPVKQQNELLEAANEYIKAGLVDGIRVSTRPDAIDPDILDNLLRYGVTTIELGIQSMCDDVLLKSNRGYFSDVVEKSVGLIREYPFKLGLQMMTGLPGDTFEKSVYTGKRIKELKPDFVRIYPTLVVKDTALCDMYMDGEYNPQTVEEAVELCTVLKTEFLNAGINVIRVSLQTTEEISPGASVVAGPFNSAFGELVDNAIYYKKIVEYITHARSGILEIDVNEREVSKAVGNGKINIRKLYEKYGIVLKVHGKSDVLKGQVKITEVS